MEILRQQRASAKGNISRIKNMLSDTTIYRNTIDLECRLDILNSYIKQVMAYQTEIEKGNPEDDKRGEIEELCISAKSLLLGLLGTHRRNETTAHENTLSILPPINHLPKLKLPKFEGKYSEYKNFIATFNSLVHEEPTLAIIEKFNHLISCLSGDALQTIKAFQINEQNYSKALARLDERYNKKTLIYFDNIEQMFEMERLSKPNASAMRNIVDTVSAIYDSLLSIGNEKDLINALLIYIALSKVDGITKSKWNDSLDYSKLPTWEEFNKVIIRRCQSIEVNEERHSNSENMAHVNKFKLSSFEKKKKSKSSFSCSKNAIDSKCLYCKSNEHYIQNCNTFSSLHVSQRFDFVKQSGMCLNCLRTGHSISTCRSSRCRVCQKPHHSLLHKYEVGSTYVPNINSQHQIDMPSTSRATNNTPNTQVVLHTGAAQNAEWNSPSNAECKASTTQVALYTSAPHDVVLLATAIVEVKDRFGKFEPVRALLDSGSQVSFISEEAAHRLKLIGVASNLNLVGIGSISSEVKRKVHVAVKSRINDFEFNSDFWIIKTISQNQPDVDLHTKSWNIPANIQLADPYFYKRQRVDLLIGADAFFELLSIGQIRLGQYLPTLQKTVLGWIVSGKCIVSPHSQVSLVANKVENCNMTALENIVRKFWEMEEIPEMTPRLTAEHVNCERHFLKNLQRLSNGRFEVRLPFKADSSILGNSFETTKRRYLS